ncbi:MAG: hypothetical protein M1838_005590 [Thelocarpon superellum]|nr:MAG: hypothetical protein M1838_005590 [Thelocarpon superellum]
MASVSSLDRDLRKMRLSKYSPQAAAEMREWIEESLGESLAPGDLLDALKDGVALCKLINLAVSPGVRYKSSSMPFVQMENISHFLRACQQPPLGLPPHDVFLTVDLYETKDPAQVLQCLGAFSRRANAINPSAFKRSIGPRSRASATSPHRSDDGRSPPGSESRSRGFSSASQSSSSTFNPISRPVTGDSASSPVGSSASPKSRVNGGTTPVKPKGPLSSWSKKSDEGATIPAWNIHQYGYMGGASQGNQGIAFGARRQITTPGPNVPSMADRERKRREELAEQERLRAEAEAVERLRKAEQEAEEERARFAEAQRWEEETTRQREKERLEAEEEKRRWEAEERRWKEEEQRRLQEEQEAKERLAKEQAAKASVAEATQIASERDRVRELELELERAKERERQYERERQERIVADRGREHAWLEDHDLNARRKEEEHRSHSRDRSRPGASPHATSEHGWREKQRDYIRREWDKHHHQPFSATSPDPFDGLGGAPASPSRLTESVQDPPHADGYDPPHKAPLQETRRTPSPHKGEPRYGPRPLPEPTAKTASPMVSPTAAAPSPRPLPDPATYAPGSNRMDRFLATNAPPAVDRPSTHTSNEFGFDSAAERHAEDARREASRAKTQAGGWASKSLLEREMERERQRQQEWEESQKVTESAARSGVGQGRPEGRVGEGGSWDVNQYGWTGGDNQNRGGVGLGGRRPIIGPRPPPQ